MDKPKDFAVEVISVENGYVILDGNSLAIHSPYNMSRQKWIAKTPEELATLILELAKRPTKEAADE